MRPLVLLVPMLVVLAIGTAACSDKTGGSAVPGTTTNQEPTGNTPTRPPTTSGQPAGSPLANKAPCSLLTSSGQAQLGISNGEERKVGSARTCRWRLRGPSETYLFDVAVYDNQGIKDLPTNIDAQPIADVGKHKAVKDTDPNNPGVCSIIMGVTDSSRVTTQATAGTNEQKGCELAMQLATLVEPELP